MKVRLLKDVSVGQDDYKQGAILDNLDPGVVDSLLGVGWAERVEDVKSKKDKEVISDGSKNATSRN
jgi:hypothetical protein